MYYSKYINLFNIYYKIIVTSGDKDHCSESKIIYGKTMFKKLFFHGNMLQLFTKKSVFLVSTLI